MPQETFVYGGEPRVRFCIAIIAVNEPAWYFDEGSPDWTRIDWRKSPKLATKWTTKERAERELRDLNVGIYDDDMEASGFAWAVGQEYRVVEVTITEKFEAKVV